LQVAAAAALRAWTGANDASWWLPAALDGPLRAVQTFSDDTTVVIAIGYGVAALILGAKLAAGLESNDRRRGGSTP
jgi:hypothetical protein